MLFNSSGVRMVVKHSSQVNGIGVGVGVGVGVMDC